MIKQDIILPFYIKFTLFLIGLIALLFGFYIGRSIFIPLIFAILIAILLNPIVNFILRIKIHRTIAIILTLLIATALVGVIGTFLFAQLSKLSESWPVLVDRITLMLDEGVIWVSQHLDINENKANGWIQSLKHELIGYSGTAVERTILGIANSIFMLFLVPVYVFLILLYKPLIINFIHQLSGSRNRKKISEIVHQTKSLVQKYLVGLVIEAIIIAILSVATLLILGIEYALLLGILGALLNIIPYIGGIIGVALPMIIALVTKDSAWFALYILGIYYLIQLIDNNIIVPKIVASKVKINALFSIIIVFVGNALWGIAGMFLSIPILAIVKLIFDHIEPLKPWGFLLGDSLPDTNGFMKLKNK